VSSINGKACCILLYPVTLLYFTCHTEDRSSNEADTGTWDEQRAVAKQQCSNSIRSAVDFL